MRVGPVAAVERIPGKLPKKELTVQGCCDNINLTSGDTYVMFGTHRFLVHIDYCKSCGAKKATSYIKEQKL